jgi:hypothetical protein
MKWRIYALVVCLCGSTTSRAQEQSTLLPDVPKPQTGIIVGTVTDVNHDTVPGATVVLEGPVQTDPENKSLQCQFVEAHKGLPLWDLPACRSARLLRGRESCTRFFEFKDVEPGTTYHITVSAQGFANWTSPAVILKPGQYAILTGGKLHIAEALTTITVAAPVASPEEMAAEQQRIFGIIPNFYVVYDHHAAPSPQLKFKLATKVLFDPVTIVGVAAFAGINQAADNPNYGQGAKGDGERFGAAYAEGFTDIMIGGAILPSLLHQDPRYFYQGRGTNKSRALHALSSPGGDNGRWQPNYSTVGGDMASAAMANAYYPASNRGVGLFFGNFLINTGLRAAANLAQEFILRRLTPKAKNQNEWYDQQNEDKLDALTCLDSQVEVCGKPAAGVGKDRESNTDRRREILPPLVENTLAQSAPRGPSGSIHVGVVIMSWREAR